MSIYRKLPVLLILAVAVLALTACGGRSGAPKNAIKAEVVSVVDGDTIKVKLSGKTETVRLTLIDTPETKHPTKPVEPFGPEASAFTKKSLEGKHVFLEKDVSDRDSYGRLLRYVWIDGKLHNETLLEKGFARVAVFPPDVKYVDRFRNVQKKAQSKKLGIWSIEDYATSGAKKK